jgi:aspartate dehydrogenase
MSPRRVALIGFGAIASDLARALLERANPSYRLGILLSPESTTRKHVPTPCTVMCTVEEVRSFAPALVVEAAGHEAVRTHVPKCLGLGLPVLITSVGALHDEALYHRLVTVAEANGGRILLPSGALGGLDYVRAARSAARLSIRYESRKPPAAWRAELLRLGRDPDGLGDAPVTLYRGSARGAASAYPNNLNVAATLALAGAGFEQTEVAVIVDPKATGHTHTIHGESELGTIRIEIANQPSPGNPKSSWIVSRSLLAAIDQHFSVVALL